MDPRGLASFMNAEPTRVVLFKVMDGVDIKP